MPGDEETTVCLVFMLNPAFLSFRYLAAIPHTLISCRRLCCGRCWDALANPPLFGIPSL